MDTPKIETTKDVDVVKSALDNKEFLAYLAKSPDQNLIDPSKPETIKKRFEMFQLKNQVYNNLKQIYAGRVKEELGINMEDKDLNSMADYVEKMSLTSPDEFLALALKLKNFGELPEKMEKQKVLVYSLGNEEKLREMEAMLAAVDAGNQYKGVIKRAFNFLDKMSLKNFEWTDLPSVDEKSNRLKKILNHVTQGAVVFYDDLRLAVSTAATVGRKVLEFDRSVRVRATSPEKKKGVEPESATDAKEVSEGEPKEVKDFEWSKLKEHKKIDSKDWKEYSISALRNLGTSLQNLTTRGYDLTRYAADTIGSFGKSVVEGISKTVGSGKEALSKVPSFETVSLGEELRNEEALREKFELSPGSSAESLQKVREKLKLITETKQSRKEMEEQLSRLKDEIFDVNLIPASIAAEAIRQKIGKEFKFVKLIGESEFGTGPLEKILEVRKGVDKILEATKDTKFDYASNMGLEKIDEWADGALEMRAVHALGTAIDNISIETEDNPLAKLENEISPFVSGSQKIKDFFVSELRSLIRKGGMDNAKILLLKMLLAKLEMQKIEAGIIAKEENAKENWVKSTKAKIDKAFS